MEQEYRYPLTRICLRNGALTLPRTMLGLFPEEGAFTAVDTRRDVEFELLATGPRTVEGLHEFFGAHDLDVNDELVIRPLEDGRFAFTPLPRARKPDYARPGAIAALLDELAEAELAATESEIRALYPDLPDDFDLTGLLEADDRFVYFEARWHARSALERQIDEEERRRAQRGSQPRGKGARQAPPAGLGPGEAGARPPQANAPEDGGPTHGRSDRDADTDAARSRGADAARQARADEVVLSREDEAVEEHAGEDLAGEDLAGEAPAVEDPAGEDPAGEAPAAAPGERQRDDAGSSVASAEAPRPQADRRRDPRPGETRQDPLWQSTWHDPWQSGETETWHVPEAGAAESPRTPEARSSAGVVGHDPAASSAAEPPGGPGARASQASPSQVPSDERSAPPSVRERRAPPQQRAVFPGDAALIGDEEIDEPIDLQHVGRARELLQGFGFRVEALGQGQLMVHAELGRRGYTALVHALGFGQRLDWAALLARRRDIGARYLAVFGDRRDLQRLQSPAELARATLWSWEGLHRARTLSQSVPVSPFDLEVHFEREGLFGHGLERFEKSVAALVAQRGAFSEVISHLAAMRAPTVFLLEDLAGGGTLSRDVVLKVLERLSEAPFHLVARVGQGEFCLRLPVGDGLANLADYATSLRSRLPSRGRERITGLGEPDWFQAEQAAAQVPAAENRTEPAAASEGAPAEGDGDADDEREHVTHENGR